MSDEIKTLFSLLLNPADPDAEVKSLALVNKTHIHASLSASGNFLIHLAAQRGMTRLVTQLINLGANPYELNRNQENALSLAYQYEHSYTVAAIYRSQAILTTNIGTFFIESVKQQDIAGLKLYFKKAGAELVKTVLNTWFRGEEANAMLHLAATLNNEPLLKLLLDWGADPHYKNREGKTAFDLLTDDHLIAQFKAPKIQPEPDKNVSSLGSPYQGNYLEFAQITKEKCSGGDYSTLGLVADSPAYYFKQGHKSKAYAQTFLNHLWSDEEGRELTRQFHESKFASEVTKNPECTSLRPSCLSFVVIRLKSTEYCLVATSFHDAKDVFDKLKAITQTINQSEKTTRYLLLSSRLTSFNDFMFNLLGSDYNASKRCAEKPYSKALIKLFLKYGNQVSVLDACNTQLYPYKQGEFYGAHPKAKIKTVTPPLGHDNLTLEGDIYTPFIPCCPTCQKNKPVLLNAMKAAQEQGQRYLDGKQPQRDLSPLRHSVKSDPRFFESIQATPSFFKKETAPPAQKNDLQSGKAGRKP